MATTSCKAEGKRSLKEMEDDEEEEDDEGGGGGGLGFAVDEKKKKGKKGFSACGSMPPVCCQAESCTADMAEAKRYYRRHKVCPYHAKVPYVNVSGIHQRFCQQCSRFHEVSEFDDTKRSCRRRLAGHNERRRKSSTEYNGEGAKLISN